MQNQKLNLDGSQMLKMKLVEWPIVSTFNKSSHCWCHYISSNSSSIHSHRYKVWIHYQGWSVTDFAIKVNNTSFGYCQWYMLENINVWGDTRCFKKRGKIEIFLPKGNFLKQHEQKNLEVEGAHLDNCQSLWGLRMVQIKNYHLHHYNGYANLSPTSLVDVNWATVFAFFGLNNQYYSHHGHCDYHEHNDHHGRLSYSSGLSWS